MIGIIVILVACVVVGIAMAKFLKNREERDIVKRMQTPIEEIEKFTGLQYMDGLKGVEVKSFFNIYANTDKLIIRSDSVTGKGLKKVFEIPSERIKQYAVITEKEIKQSKKSVVGRAVVGGLLLGGIGAVVGGMSALPGDGVKEGKEQLFFIINYIDANGEVAAISFLLPSFIKDPEIFDDEVAKFSELAGIKYVKAEERRKEDGTVIL